MYLYLYTVRVKIFEKSMYTDIFHFLLSVISLYITRIKQTDSNLMYIRYFSISYAKFA